MSRTVIYLCLLVVLSVALCDDASGKPPHPEHQGHPGHPGHPDHMGFPNQGHQGPEHPKLSGHDHDANSTHMPDMPKLDKNAPNLGENR